MPSRSAMAPVADTRLQRDNVVASLVHLARAVAVVTLATSFALPVSASHL
jgi:hypothetical protein